MGGGGQHPYLRVGRGRQNPYLEGGGDLREIVCVKPCEIVCVTPCDI